jgi:hypothetical protein
METIIVSGLFAGVVAIGVTVAIEYFGGRLGGILGTIPTTIVPASVGIYSVGGPGDPFCRAMAVVPVGMLLNGLFLWLWRTLPPRIPGDTIGRRLTTMITISLGVWLVGATTSTYALKTLGEGCTPALICGFSATLLLTTLGLLSSRKPLPAPKGTRRVGVGALAARGLMASIAIGVCVVIADCGGDVAAGVASVFPAIFMTTMVSLWLDQGEAVPIGAAGPMILGSTSVCLYALASIWTVQAFGIGWGSLGAWIFALVASSLPAGVWLHRKKVPV